MNPGHFVDNLRHPEIRRDFDWSATHGLVLSLAMGVALAASAYPLSGAWSEAFSFGIGVSVSTALLLYLFKSPAESGRRSLIKRFLAWLGVLLS